MPGNGWSATASVHRVLIVANDDAIRRFLGRALESFGCEAYLARDGPEVLAALRGRTMCAVIVDVPWPGTSCWSVLKATSGLTAGWRSATIALSTDARALTMAAGLGVRTTLLMPFSLQHLQAAIDGVVAREGSAHRPTTPIRPPPSLRRLPDICRADRSPIMP
jgi:DNA-binding response OmpR family regulator